MDSSRSENTTQRERIDALSARADEDLGRLVGSRWTVAAHLAHLAFWDRFALLLLDRWLSGEAHETETVDWHDDVLNDALLAEWLAIEPRRALRLAQEATRQIDERLSHFDEETIGGLLTGRDTAWLLRRARHRMEHLEAIEAALAGAAQ